LGGLAACATPATSPGGLPHGASLVIPAGYFFLLVAIRVQILPVLQRRLLRRQLFRREAILQEAGLLLL